MVLNNAVAAAVCTAVLALASPAVADQYRPDEFLGLDLSRAVLSPKPLGPPTEFAPVAVEAKSDGATESEQARAVPKAERQVVVRSPMVIAANAQRPRVPAGLPADILRQRPDVAEAEQNLIRHGVQIRRHRAWHR
jgi:hypothetical protein